MSAQLKEQEPFVAEAVIESLLFYNQPLYDIGGNSTVMTFRRPYLDSEGRASFERGDAVYRLIKSNLGIGEFYLPTYRLQAFIPGAEPDHFFVLEYDAESNEHVLLLWNFRELSCEHIVRFSSPVSLQCMAHSEGQMYIWGLDEENSTFELWAVELATSNFKKLGAYQSTPRFSAAVFNGEIFFSGLGAIYRQTPVMEEPALLRATAGEIFDMAVVEGNLLYLGELSGGQIGLGEISLKDGNEIRTIPMNYASRDFRLVVRGSVVFIYQHYHELSELTDGKRRALPRIDYLDGSGRVYPVGAVEVGDIDSLHIDEDTVYWCEVSAYPLRWTIRRIRLENLPAAEIVDAEKLWLPLPYEADEVQQVYEDDYRKRQDAYDQLFSPIDDRVTSIIGLNDHCPGNCIMYAKPEKLPYSNITFTFGFAGALAGRELDRRRHSGYGFELIAATTVAGNWLGDLFNYIMTDHTSGEFDYFFDFTEKGGVLLGPLDGTLGLLGEETTYFIAPAWGAMPKELDVGYGKISFVNVINVTDAEVRYANAHGGADALLKKFREANVEPIIDPTRKSVV